jgi:hypothetical protein
MGRRIRIGTENACQVSIEIRKKVQSVSRNTMDHRHPLAPLSIGLNMSGKRKDDTHSLDIPL